MAKKKKKVQTPKKYRVYLRRIRDDVYRFLDSTSAVSGMQARNTVRYNRFRNPDDPDDNGLSFDELRQHGVELFAAAYGSKRDIELFNLTRPGQKPIQYFSRPELPVKLPVQGLLPGMSRNAQLL